MNSTDGLIDSTPLVIVQARMGSSRLPGKVLKRAGGWTMLEHLLRALRASEHHPEIVVATTTAPADAAVVAEAVRLGVHSFCGSEDDVLARYAGALAKHPAEVVVRVTADCPLLDTAELDRVVAEFYRLRSTAAEVDYLTNQDGETRRIPRGADVEVISARTLERAQREARADYEREHVTPYIYLHPAKFRIARSHYPGRDLSHLRITVDTPEDLELVRRVVDALGPNPKLASVGDFLDTHPEVRALNSEIKQKGVVSEQQLRRDKIAGRLLVGCADVGFEAGLGHGTRLGALLAGWCELGGRAVLFGSGIVGGSRERLTAAGVEILDAGASSTNDPERLLTLARSGEAAAIAVDGRSFDAGHQRKLAAEFPLVTLDDLAAFAPEAQLVVNQNLGFCAATYPASPSTRLLVGVPYLLLRREQREAAARAVAYVPGSHPPRILIAFSSPDPRGLTLPLVCALLPRLPPAARVSALLGPSTEPILARELAALAATDPRLALPKDILDVEQQLQLPDTDLAVLEADVTTCEALALGVPVVAVVTHEAQRVAAQELERLGATRVLGLAEELDLERLVETVLELAARPEERAMLSARGRALVDARGVWRVIDALLTCAEQTAARTPAQAR